DAADVERAHGELGARLADGLRGDDADRVAGLGHAIGRGVDAVALAVDAGGAGGGQRRHDLHALDAGLNDLVGNGLGDEFAGADEELGGIERVVNVVGRAAADDAFLEADDFVVTLVDGLLPDAVAGAGVFLGDDHVHGDVAQLTGEVAGVGGLEGGVGETLAGAVGGDEVFQHGQTFAEGRQDGALDDFAGGLGHQTAGAAQLANLLFVTAGTGVHHDVNRVHVLAAFVVVQLGEHGLGDAVGGAGPDVDDLVVALAFGDDALGELAFDFGDLFAGVGDDVLFVIGDDHVVDTDGDAGLHGGLEAELLELVEGLDGGLHVGNTGGIEDEIAELALRNGEVHEAEAFGPDLVEN